MQYKGNDMVRAAPPPALGIGAASFRSAAEKDTAESPTATAGTHKKIIRGSSGNIL